MTAHAAVRLVAAFMIFLSLFLAHRVHPGWLGLAAFVGLNLTQFSFTGICPALFFLKKLGLRPAAPGPDLEAVRKAQIIVGLTVLLVIGVGLLAPGLGLGFIAIALGLVALSFGQSAFTGTCLAIALARRLERQKTVAG